MCKTRLVHFSVHDVRLPMATALFTAPGTDGGGDFVTPRRQRPCLCRLQACELLQDRDNRPPYCPMFEVCPQHDCCLVWRQASRCRWYYDNAGAPQFVHVDNVEIHCPNAYILCEYKPISMVLDLDEEANGRSEFGQPGERKSMPPWDTCTWKADAKPLFPAGELLYSNHFEEEKEEERIPGSWGLTADRDQVTVMGEYLWVDKKSLYRVIRKTSECLDRMDLSLSSGADFRLVVAQDPLHWIRTASDMVRRAHFFELRAARTYKKMMQRMKFVFTALHKMPGPGQSVVASDGSYSVSREQLDMGDLDPAAIIEACEGPLKQVAKLEERLRVIKDDLLKLKRRRGRAAENLRRPPRMRIVKAGSRRPSALKGSRTRRR
ncbi:ea0beff5-da68-4bfd-9208-2c1a9eb179ee [Thermothielavioides terrestris]|uniref:Uncharacterized protein n=2 Tax=Thermothielavioides terrestris TaxID=2587410 RepID=G2R897_THETT|nr:uncharacterized protein THITE_117572 [Thermothielavioides terrestris NRRL 8126]AEO68156.1 hypothetical protein THITE_117572 [Thermothielavioides terrestris NRRL 8126]SPQ24597.1 ea0beff5-da68-4bfd-9208-2c1a9eb179ee [Thermothielavioides terrestris]